MRKTITLLLLLFMFAGCSNDDWSPYRKDVKNYNKVLEESEFLVALAEQIDPIIYEKDTDLVLSNITITYEGVESLEKYPQKITWEYSKTSDNMQTKMQVFYDFSQHSVYAYSWEYGHSKRVGAYESKISREILEIRLPDLFNYFSQQEKYIAAKKDAASILILEMYGTSMTVTLLDGTDAAKVSSLYRESFQLHGAN